MERASLSCQMEPLLLLHLFPRALWPGDVLPDPSHWLSHPFRLSIIHGWLLDYSKSATRQPCTHSIYSLIHSFPDTLI